MGLIIYKSSLGLLVKPAAFSKSEFTQYPFFVRFRPFFYVFASP